MHSHSKTQLLALLLFCSPLLAATPREAMQVQQQGAAQAAADLLGPLLRGEQPCALQLEARKGDKLEATLQLVVEGPDRFVLDLDSKLASLRMARSSSHLQIDLRHVKTRLIAKGSATNTELSLAPRGFSKRLLQRKEPLLGAFYSLLRIRLAAAQKSSNETLEVRALPGGGLAIHESSARGFAEGIDELRLQSLPTLRKHDFEATTQLELPRAELEASLFRALRRFTRIYVPALRESQHIRARTVPGGALRSVQGQRLVILRGNPEQLGRAHGQLLGPLLSRTIDSYVHLVGAVETLRTGKYFLDELRQAWRRLAPHIPQRHLREIDALAASANVDTEELRLANVLPEYFHCSGFAVFGKATKDGTLYHGRVLDYMTAIGLQDAAATFYVEPDEGHAFVHVGYAGFVGVVTGLNEKQLALGEMGGRGRYQWDGVPMACLMRRTLEECRNLAELRALWRSVPRTCEYYYVASHSDGKRHDALGIAATPERIQFLAPGEAHELLGAGIQDCVYLSAGSRLRHLRERIQKQHGHLDLPAALRLMDRPVAMRSNLHNALMLPATGEIHVAHAKGSAPAATQPYARFRLPELRKIAAELPRPPRQRRLRIDEQQGCAFVRHGASSPLLQRSDWTPRSFSATLETLKNRRHVTLRYPSPRPIGIAQNDRVVLEWYPATGRHHVSDRPTPAILCLHILDGRMLVARAIARAASYQGIHGFVMHMPGYGERGRDARRAMKLFEARAWQCIADLRRSHRLIAQLPGIDPRRIWLQGTSLGGMMAALGAAAEPGFAGHFFVLAGGGLPSMLENGEFDSAKVRHAFERSGISNDQMESILSRVDPARLGEHIDAARTWMFNARDDRVVPATNARILAQSIGITEKQHIWFPGGHYTIALFMPAVLDAMWRIVQD
jgi:dienelactone hydrolase